MSENDLIENLGFSSFRNNKKAKNFDFMKIFNESKMLATLRNEVNNKKAEASMNESKNEASSSTSNSSRSDSKPGCKTLSKDQTRIGKNSENSDEDVESDDELTQKLNSPYFIPDESEFPLNHGHKTLTAMHIDASGSRVATGGLDFQVRLWDFAGMDKCTKPFKSFSVHQENQIYNLEFSPSGDNLLILTATPMARVVSREGEQVADTVRGYPYITNPSGAYGHTHCITGGIWHPIENSVFITSSLDSTIRVWDLQEKETHMCETRIPKHTICIKCRDAKGQKTIPTCVDYSKEGNLITCACRDGSIQIWDIRTHCIKPSKKCNKAHAANVEVSSIAWSWNSLSIATRAFDDTCKQFDLRLFERGHSDMLTGLPNNFSQTEVNYSPNDKMIIAAVSEDKRESQPGYLLFIRRDTFKEVHRIPRKQGSVVRANWHAKTNQVYSAFSDGSASVYYDSQGGSCNGALMCSARQATDISRTKQRGLNTGSDSFIAPILLTYAEDEVTDMGKYGKKYRYHKNESEVAVHAVQNALDSIKEEHESRKLKEAQAKMPNRIDPRGGSEGSMHKYMVQKLVLKNKPQEDFAEKDIRAAILQHAESAKKDPYWTKAYKDTQPHAVLQKKVESDDEDDSGMLSSKRPKIIDKV